MPAGPAMLAQQTGALLLPVTLWYDDSPVMRAGCTRPSRSPPTGDRARRTAVMTQALADAYASGIAAHPRGLAHAAAAVAGRPGAAAGARESDRARDGPRPDGPTDRPGTETT